MKRNLLTPRGSQRSIRQSRPSTSRQIIEQLELRRMLSVTYNAATDTVSLNGTGANDSYTVSLIAATATAKSYVKVTEGLAIHKFPTATKPVVRVSATLLAGTDTVTMASTLNIPLSASGGTEADVIVGGAAADNIDGGDGGDVITGNDGKDTLNGGSGPDFIHGNNGDDSINGAAENDTLYGDQGIDTISGGDDSDDRIYGGTENDILNGDQGNDTINGNEGNDTIHGNDGRDSLSGDTGTDSIFGDADNDTLNGNDGNDTLRGGTHNDYLDGGKNNDSLLGEAGNDSMWGRENNDTLNGSSGNDTLRGEGGKDNILAGSDNDDADGGSGNDTLNGDAGTDTVHGGSNDDLVRGGAGNDLVYGDAGNDSVYGGGGIDTLFGGSGLDGLFGGADGLEDSVYGDSGNDRFLNKYTGGSAVGQNWEDDIRDKTNDDARLGFKNGPAVTGLSFSGQTGTYDYAAGVWSDTEIEQLDGALAILHYATDNKELLEQKHGNEIEMLRHGAQTAANGGTFSAAAWNDGGQIHVVSLSIETILHEIGHYWDREYDKNGWWAVSGWVKNPADTTGLTQALDASGTWWYSSTASFVSNYAKTTPDEDFGESFSNYFMNLGGLTFVGDAGLINITNIPSKESFFDDMVTDLS